METLDYTKIDNVILENVQPSDYPDFSDAFILSADYNGQTMTEEQIDKINQDQDFVYEQVLNWIQ